MTQQVVAALQIGASPEGTEKTLENILSYEQEILDSGAKLVVLPEATLGGYPKGSTFDTYLGYRMQTGREEFAEYHKGAIEVPGPETRVLEGLAARTGALITVGVIERDNSTLYCTLVYVDSDNGYVGKHRKLMPTATERLVWGQGDGSTLFVAESRHLGKVGGAICWENYMPLLRQSFYSKNVKVYIAPTVDEREIWRSLMKTISAEGRQYTVSAVSYLGPPDQVGLSMPGWEAGRNSINGGSVIVDPYGEIIAGPLLGKEGLLTAKIDLDRITEAKYDFDVAGHYARNDVFKLIVDEREKKGVEYLH